MQRVNSFDVSIYRPTSAASEHNLVNCIGVNFGLWELGTNESNQASPIGRRPSVRWSVRRPMRPHHSSTSYTYSIH